MRTRTKKNYLRLLELKPDIKAVNLFWACSLMCIVLGNLIMYTVVAFMRFYDMLQKKNQANNNKCIENRELLSENI